MSIGNMLRHLFSVPVHDGSEEKEAMENITCAYCDNPVPAYLYGKHRETCVRETGGFVKTKEKVSGH